MMMGIFVQIIYHDEFAERAGMYNTNLRYISAMGTRSDVWKTRVSPPILGRKAFSLAARFRLSTTKVSAFLSHSLAGSG